MKKILFILCMIAGWNAYGEACANGGGTVVTGVDGTRYCYSTPSMNWWSAHSWCETAHGKLFDINAECYKVEGSAQCPNIANKQISAWTSNLTGQIPSTVGTPGAYTICGTGGICNNHSGNYYGFSEKIRVLCTLDEGY